MEVEIMEKRNCNSLTSTLPLKSRASSLTVDIPITVKSSILNISRAIHFEQLMVSECQPKRSLVKILHNCNFSCLYNNIEKKDKSVLHL